jgi:PAS domain S-box-containing protein
MNTIRVIHVDDDPSVVDLSQSFLEKSHDGFTVEPKTDPQEILRQLRSGSLDVDCIVSDYRMPEMDGLELLEAVREHDTDIPFVLFTGEGSEEIAADAIAAGVTEYLQKSGSGAYSILANRIQNVVENYRRQQELDRIHEQYQCLIENSSDIACIQDADGVIQYISDSVERILGIDPESLLGQNVFEFIHPDDRNRVLERFSELQARESMTDITVRYRCQDASDEWRWLEAVFTDARDSPLEGVVVNARDVTAQMERKQELERQNDLFEAVEELASVGGWEYDVRTETLYWTDEIRRIHDLPSEYEPTFDDAIEFYHPDDRPRVREALEAAIEDGEPFEFECRLKTAGGETRWVSAHGRPQREDGSIVRIRGAVVDITEQKANERKLQAFREAVESAGHAIYWTDPEGTIEYANRAFEEMTGYDRDAVVGEPSSILQSGVHTDEFYETMWETIIDGETWENELVNERKSGERYTIHQTISPILDDDGTIQRYVAVNQDITDRKEQQRQLNALFETTRELFREDTQDEIAATAVEAARKVLDLSINGIHLYDEDCEALVPTAMTDKATNVIGELPAFESGEGVAWEVFESGEPQIYDDVRTARDAYNSDTAIRSEYVLPLGDHGVFLAGSVEPNAFEDRTVSLAKLLATNVEAALDRLAREADLRDTSQRLQTVLNHTPDALFVLDDDQRIVEVNEQACSYLGYEREELLGMHRSEIGRSKREEEKTATDVDPLAPLREDPDAIITREGRHIRKDGSDVPVRVKVTRIEQNGENRFLAIARDISEIKAQQEQLRRQNEQLEEFAGIVSHDLRSPLATARTGVELASRIGDGFNDSLERVERAHDRMEALIDELLALARNGQMIDEENTEPIDLSDAAARGWDLISATDAELRIENAGTIVADESRLQQLLENLFRNAIDHGGDTITVRVGMLQNGFYVEDDGPGIPENDREEVFTPGYTTRDDGTGFGLGIVRNVADAHGWEVAITDSPDGGARFEFAGVKTQDVSS